MIEIGTGYSSDDSYRFAKYSGISEQGAVGIGGFLLQGDTADDDNRYWQLSGRQLGLEAASLAASYRRWGEFSFSLNYDQIPHYRFNDGLTPFLGSGSAVQTLPTGWTGASSTAGFSALTPANLNQVNVDTHRDRITSALNWRLNPNWQVFGEFRHEIKQGTDDLGAIFGITGGNPRGSIVIRPVDYQTDELTFGISYQRQRSQLNLSYNTLRFSNDNKALRFDNPFNNPQWSSGANFSDGAVGQIALEPDNQSYQFNLSGAHSFGNSTRLSGSIITSRLEQDDSFLPYSSVFEASTPLPRSILGGRIDSLATNLKLSTRLTQRGTLNLRYNYRERDNRTPQALYLRIPGDATEQGGPLSSQARVNRLYDLERETLAADVHYRFTGRTRLALGYEFEETDRSMLDAATTEEDTGYIKLDFRPGASSSAWIKLSRAERDASAYDSTVPFIAGHNPDYIATLVGNDLFENDPLLRRFHLTDRNRDELSGSLNLFPTELLGITLMASIAADDYPDARIGLRESDKRSYALDLSLTPAEDWNASVYYNFENYSNRQTGYSRRGGGNPTPFFPESVRLPGNNWLVTSEDIVHSLGSSLEVTLIPNRLDISLNAVYTDAETETTPFSTGLEFLPLPDVDTTITTLDATATYRLSENRRLALGYFLQRYRSSDFALDDVGVATLSNILLLGNQSWNHTVHFVSLSMVMNF